jgi:hypothetical protein
MRIKAILIKKEQFFIVINNNAYNITEKGNFFIIDMNQITTTLHAGEIHNYRQLPEKDAFDFLQKYFNEEEFTKNYYNSFDYQQIIFQCLKYIKDSNLLVQLSFFKNKLIQQVAIKKLQNPK